MVFFLLPIVQAKAEVKYDPCPKGKPYHNLCLFVSSKAGAYAAPLCKNDGGVRFMPKNAKENKAAAAIDKGRMWIAGNDVDKEGTWKSNDPRGPGKITYFNWNTKQPDNAGGKEDCIEINWGAPGKWNDLVCAGHDRKSVCAMPRTVRVEHPHVMSDLNVVKNLIDAVAASHSDMDGAVEKVHNHVKSFKSVKNKAIGDLQKIRDQLSVMKGTLADKAAKLKAEDEKITGALAQLKAKWMKLNAQQSEKLDDAEERRATENAKISKMITHLSRRRRRSME